MKTHYRIRLLMRLLYTIGFAAIWGSNTQGCMSDRSIKTSRDSVPTKPILFVDFRDRCPIDSIESASAYEVVRNFEAYTASHIFDRKLLIASLRADEAGSDNVIHYAFIFNGNGSPVTMGDLEKHVSWFAQDVLEAHVYKKVLLTFVIQNTHRKTEADGKQESE